MTRTYMAMILSAATIVLGASVGCGDDTGDGGSGTTTTTTGSTTTTSTTTTSTTTTGSSDCTTLCATYGPAVPAVAGTITDRAAADPMFMADFEPLVMMGPDAVNMFKASLAAFISDAYGCTTGTYMGPTMEDAHAGLDITQDEYNAFLGLIVDVLTEAGVPDDYVTDCFAPALTDPDFANTIIGQ